MYDVPAPRLEGDLHLVVHHTPSLTRATPAVWCNGDFGFVDHVAIYPEVVWRLLARSTIEAHNAVLLNFHEMSNNHARG